MPLPPDQKDLTLLAHKLATNGPVKTSPTPRRVRIQHNNLFVADTTSALYVWEHGGYPYFYLPWSAFRGADHKDESVKWSIAERGGEKGAMWAVWTLSVTGPTGQTVENNRILSFQCDNASESPASVLSGCVRVEFLSVDGWYEEDVPIHVHPKDPFKRIELLPSSRHLKFTLPSPSNSSKDVILAEVSSSIHLHETGLPTRFYFPITALPWEKGMIKNSRKNTKTQCPYKGEAGYFDLVLEGGNVVEDVIWYYAFGKTTPDCGSLAGTCCFYNEKVDTWVDGVKQERPKTWFS
ncbi:MAG: hypothetical protein Q9162_004594 [Coniocarpon cinnabarinum]